MRVTDAATDPELTDDGSLQVRERLAAAGLLAPGGPSRPRPAGDDLAEARRRAGQGHHRDETAPYLSQGQTLKPKYGQTGTPDWYDYGYGNS